MIAKTKQETALKIIHTGVYGIAKNNNQILLVTQQRGPYRGKFDLPGGRIEFGETIEQALHREFQEEINMSFNRMALLDNLAITVQFRDESGNICMFHHIGLIYSVSGISTINVDSSGCLDYSWIEAQTLNTNNASPFVLAILHKH